MVLQLDTARVEAARAGDPAALDAVVAQYLPLVYTVVRRSLRRSADVDDVVQDTMLHVVRGVGSLRDPERMRAWVVAVAVNQIREHHRRAPAYSAPFDERADYPDPGGEFVEHTLMQIDVSGQRREAQQAAQWLDPDHRELLALWWLEASGHLSRPELADALQADPHHVAVRVSRMKEQLDTARRLVRALALNPRCPVLEQTGYEWGGETSSVWRKRFARHLRECRRCDSAAHGMIAPERLLAGLALLPLPAAYAGFRATETLVYPQQVTLGDPAHGGDPTQVHSGLGHGAEGDGGYRPDAHGGDGQQPPVRHRGGSHRGGKGAGGKASAGLIGKPLGIAVAAVGVLAVAAAAVVELRPQQQDTSIAVTSTSTALGAASASASASAIVLPSTSLAPSSPPASSAKPSTAAPSTHAATSTSPAARQTSAAAAAPSSSAASTSSNSSSAADQVLSDINAARAQAGLKPYTMSSDLINSASAHNTRMEDGCGLSHQCSGEAALGDRETAAGVQWTAAGENIGEGGPVDDTTAGIAQMAVGLTNSMLAEQPPNDGHRLNILSSSFTEVGIAVTRDSSGTVWMTQDFAN